MALQADNIADLVVATLKDLGEMKFTEIATDLQEFVAMRNLLRKNRIVLDSGYGIQWQVMIDHSNAANFVGLYATDNVNVGDVMKQATMPWRHVTTNYAIDRRELAMNRSARRIVDLLKIRRIDAMIALAAKFEDRFWAVPAVDDETNPHGVPHWIVKSNSTGFNGTVPSGYTTVAGLNPTTYPRWTNYTAQYTNVTKDDFVRKARAMATKTKFMAPVEGIPTYNTGDTKGYYTNYACLGLLEELLEAQNDRLGTDLASMDGRTLFRKVDVVYVPKLDADTTNPFYQIPWGDFKTYVLRGEWLNETKIDVMPNQHTVAAVHVDCSLNWIMKNRRTSGVIATNTGLP